MKIKHFIMTTSVKLALGIWWGCDLSRRTLLLRGKRRSHRRCEGAPIRLFHILKSLSLTIYWSGVTFWINIINALLLSDTRCKDWHNKRRKIIPILFRIPVKTVRAKVAPPVKLGLLLKATGAYAQKDIMERNVNLVIGFSYGCLFYK